jgi:hypothetical protein
MKHKILFSGGAWNYAFRHSPAADGYSFYPLYGFGNIGFRLTLIKPHKYGI